MEVQKPQQYTGVITQKLQLTKNVYHFVIQNDQPKELLFTPGQYATFIIDSKTRRQYSFCSPPTQSSFEMIIDVSPMGLGSKYFSDRSLGDRVEYLAPLGTFTMNDSPLHKVFISTGTGIAPFRSMLLHGVGRSSVFDQRKDIDESLSVKDELGTLDCSLYWGLRFEQDLYWLDEFTTLARQYRGFKFFVSLSKPSASWTGLTGRIPDHVFLHEENLENSEFYICGNNAMISDMKTLLLGKNVDDKRIKLDLFY